MNIVKNQHILVLGGSGFIGRAVISALQNKGCRITAMVRQSPVADAAHSQNDAGPVSGERVEIITGDIRTFNWSRLEDDLPDTIIHLARIPGRRRLSRWLAGLRGKAASRRLVRWLGSLSRPPHLVFVSGTLVYGDRGKETIDETASLQPIAFQRDYIKAETPFLDQVGKEIPVSIVRPPWVIGGGSWFRQFYYNSAKNGTITQYGKGNNVMSLIHVDDCAGQICSVAFNGDSGRIYNLCSCPPILHSEFIQKCADMLNAVIEVRSDKELLNKYGRALYEALTFSLDVTSCEPLVRDYPNRFPDANAAIAGAVAECRRKSS